MLLGCFETVLFPLSEGNERFLSTPVSMDITMVVLNVRVCIPYVLCVGIVSSAFLVF